MRSTRERPMKNWRISMPTACLLVRWMYLVAVRCFFGPGYNTKNIFGTFTAFNSSTFSKYLQRAVDAPGRYTRGGCQWRWAMSTATLKAAGAKSSCGSPASIPATSRPPWSGGVRRRVINQRARQRISAGRQKEKVTPSVPQSVSRWTETRERRSSSFFLSA